MSVFTWSIEFLTGGVFIFMAVVTNDIKVIIIFGFFDCILSFVIIPGAYILNTEVTKAGIVKYGWFRSFRTLFPSKAIQPAANNNLV